MTRTELLTIANPILFNTEMERAILDGRKSATRRVVKPHNAVRAARMGGYHQGDGLWIEYNERDNTLYIKDYSVSACWISVREYIKRFVRYKPGDILYVQETWQYAYDMDGNDQFIEGTGRYLYAADNDTPLFNFWIMPDGTHRDTMPWRHSIHMPREAARLFLRVTDVRAERLQDITDSQVEKEGVRTWSKDGKLYKYAAADYEGDGPNCTWSDCPRTPKDGMKRLWNSTIKPADITQYGWDANPWVWVIEFERVVPE